MTLELCLDLSREKKVLLIGDVHGELGLLEKVLKDPEFKDHYKLCIGDLFDRGPDSPGCFELIRDLRAKGEGSSIMGNHELNTAIGDEKEGNGWFFNNFERNTHEKQFLPCSILEPQRQAEVLNFIDKTPLFAKLPQGPAVAVHAYYCSSVVKEITKVINQGDFDTWKSLYDFFDQKIKNKYCPQGYENWIKTPQWQAFLETEKNPFQKALITKEIAQFQYAIHMENPLKILLAGPLSKPIKNLEHIYYAGGRWRACDRQKWWNSYTKKTFVIFGHYWRKVLKERSFSDSNFGETSYLEWLGKNKNAFCVDYSAGFHFKLRNGAETSDKLEFKPCLGVLSWPDKKVKIYSYE